jgi:O-antigen/teichoic acid export membrane protein
MFKQKIFKEASLLFSSKFISAIFAFLYTVLMARYLGSENFGVISYALAFTGIFAIFADFGLQNLSIREISRRKNSKKYFENLLGIKVISSLATATFTLIITILFNYPFEKTFVVLSIVIYMILNSFNGFYYAVHQAFQNYKYLSIFYLLNNVLMLLLVIVGIYFNTGIIYYAIIYAVSSLVVFLFNFKIILNYFGRFKLDFEFKLLKEIFNESISFLLVGLFVVIYFKIDSVMISFMMGDYYVGLYNASYRIIDGLTYILPSVIFSLVYPKMSKNYNIKDALRKLYKKVLLISFFVGLCASLFVTLFSKEIILMIYGLEYLGSVSSLKILVWAFFVICISSITSGMLTAVNKQKIVAYSTGVGAFINVILNLILIPAYGLSGAAFATLATEVVGFFIYIYYVMKYLSSS